MGMDYSAKQKVIHEPRKAVSASRDAQQGASTCSGSAELL